MEWQVRKGKEKSPDALKKYIMWRYAENRWVLKKEQARKWREQLIKIKKLKGCKENWGKIKNMGNTFVVITQLISKTLMLL